jgi:hypothetical protein
MPSMGAIRHAPIALAIACGPKGSSLPIDTTDAGFDPTRTDPVCKPAAGAQPEVVLGQGQNDFLSLADLQTVQVEAGPQGGHHIWMAVRMKNLLRSGSRTTLTAVAPESGTRIEPFDVLFTFDPDAGGYCKLFGLRFQLDLGGVDYVPLLGKELDVQVTIVDRAGDSGEDARRVTLSPIVLGSESTD